jgi:hypothetical protein
MRLAGLIALAAASAVVISGAAHASDGLALRGYGTAVVDSVLAPGEWDTAGHYDFQANRSPAEGGGTVPATLFVMNDATNLYLGLRVSVTALENSAFDSAFEVPGSPFGPGNDYLRAVQWGFEDSHWHQTSPATWELAMDTAFGGTVDGESSVSVNGGIAVFEVKHPLNSTDDLHDFSLSVPSHIGYVGSFLHCVAGFCADTNITSGLGKIVVVSGTHVPPDTTIADGPAEGAQVDDYGYFEFAATDDVAPPSELTFQCSVDSEEWTDCETPYGPATTVDGWHTLSVRALDDMLNADPTPATRRWRVDNHGPSKPTVVVSRRQGKTELRLSATDRGTPSKQLRFRCAIDSKRLHACASRFRLRLPAGRHFLRVRAADPAGNESSLKIARFVVRRSA